jgi:signal transduction histidine kinase
VALILAVDDESSGLYFRKLILEHAGHIVLSSTGVQEALTLFRSNPIDIVVTDHLLGRQTGNDMAAEMKRTKPDVPIILLSGTSSVPEPLVHADSFLSKTEGPEQLLEMVEQLLSRNSVVPADALPERTDRPQLQGMLASIVEDSDDAILEKRFDSVGRVIGVSGELRQVIANLVANAIDALSVVGTKLKLHVYESADWRNLGKRGIRLVVADDGPGINTETQANLFRPFYTTKGQKGTGLGLWVSQGIVTKHGGSIRLRSRTGTGHGTCFAVFLPIEA